MNHTTAIDIPNGWCRFKRFAWLGALLMGCLAAGPAWCDQWTLALTPTTASAQSFNNALEVYVTTSQAVVNPANCPSVDGYVAIDPLISKEALAIAMTAITAGRQIQIYLSSTQCAQNRPMVLYFTML